MKSVALVTEYNPFHNGHLYHAQTSKSITDSEISIAIMSGNFVMRGQPAIYNKFIRTRMALNAVDLVIELPAVAALSAGQYFAETAVQIASYVDADHLSFGSESGDIDSFHELQKDISKIEQTSEFLMKLKEGKSYPRILSELLNNHTLLSSPNNTLGVSYMRAIQKLAPHIKPWTISRESSHHHDFNISNLNFASGTAIRNALQTQNDLWKSVVPNSIQQLYQEPHATVEDTFPYIKYAILSHTTHSLKNIYTMSEGLENRILDKIRYASSFEHLMSLIKTKRYTYTHIQRVLMNILLNFQHHHKHNSIKAVHILGMSPKGQQYLKYLKQKFPERHFITQLNQQNAHLFEQEIHSTHIYNLLSNRTETDFNTHVLRIED
ncbi:nucleotidyltransferase [Staphylococcus cohnii]|uniref:tRNA(Met) cytidine acetate ligase n=1 Tax=Staphylococcus cohnii TaxID=29382 RepID=A0ABT6IZE6_9STAP|nr:nucleotidyltransferase [Staphylococcus cohnii]AYX89552.1 nucleotidyltransferase [Staphylococcus cohnii]MCI2940215.1 nucleotidyltransferase [Staphylococcus cohnii]MDH5139074.1 nucleotidyltransferase [Staphylococcus cohnii]MDH5157188.1 nucleotidyltransferase [Staphylococcus cohnii]MDH5168635.1 nucleotidyltransferase [Staphylococcus cohnii]